MKDIFNINNFNIIDDNEYYYFFRALNNGDNNDIEENITTDLNGNIKRIRTDRERYGKDAIYQEDSTLSLEEIYNHIKTHHRTDTNCISLTSNSNVGIMYGREFYKDKYIIVKVPKKDLGKKVVPAAAYMIEEIEKKINKLIQEQKVDQRIIDLFNEIDEVSSTDELNKIISRNNIKSISQDMFQRGIEFNYSSTNSSDYNALSDEQNLIKNKLITKIDLLNENIIENVSNKKLIETLGSAISSLELTHYKDIKKSEIIDIPKEIMDIFSLIQQLPSDVPERENILEEIFNYIKNGSSDLKSFTYQGYELDDEDYTIEKMYKLTEGDIDYQTSMSTYKKSFYFAKSKLRTIHIVNQLKKITNNNPKYNEIYNYLLNSTYGIEPKVFTRKSLKKIPVSESLSLDFNTKEKELFNMIDNLPEYALKSIIKNPLDSLKKIIRNLSYVADNNQDQNTYYANAIIDSFDWSKLNIVKIYDDQRQDIIDKLKEYNCYKLYEDLKSKNVKEKRITDILLKTIIKNKDIININSKDSFTVEELEDFLGYYTIKDTKLKLKSYQAITLENINKLLEEKNFTAAVLPTGAGKSFVALAKMLENKNAKMLYLAPNVEILNQIKRYVKLYVYGTKNTSGKSDDEIIKEVFPNIVLSTYAYLKEDNAKEIRNSKYDLVIFDEIHRTGANEWYKYVKETIDHQKDKVKVLGISATPQRDMDLNNMADLWAEYFGYTEEEINSEKHLAINMDIIDGINAGYITNPKIVNCEYSLKNSEQLETMKYQIEDIQDESMKKDLKNKYETLRRNIDKSNGIETILNEYLKNNGKYIVFIPVTKKDDGEYEDEDGNSINKSRAERIIQAYQNQIQQYLFAGKFIENNKEIFKEIEKCLDNNITFSYEIITWLYENKTKIQSLTRIDILKNNMLLVSKINELAERIIERMGWSILDDQSKGKILQKHTKKYLETYSMSSSYYPNKNRKELNRFNTTDSNKLKLMFVMNKLNEGVHVDKIDGIIWLRPMDENSKILYLQQLGRCIYPLDPNQTPSDEERPLVIDFVNNSLTVNLEKGELLESRDLNTLKLINNYISQNGDFINNINEYDKLEVSYIKTLARIKKKYNKYLINSQLLNKYDYKIKSLIDEVLNEGKKLDLWNLDLIETEQSEYDRNSSRIRTNTSSLEINGILRDYVELRKSVDKYIQIDPEIITQELLDYLSEVDDKTKTKNVLTTRTEKRLSSGIKMGIYYTQESRDVKILSKKKILNDEEQRRIKNFEEIARKNEKNKTLNQIQIIQEKTEKILEYLNGFTEDGKRNTISINNDNLSFDMKIKSYYMKQKNKVKLIQEKQSEDISELENYIIKCTFQIERQNNENHEYNNILDLHNKTQIIMDYLNAKTEKTNLKNTVSTTMNNQIIDGLNINQFYAREIILVRKLKEKNSNELSKYEKERIKCLERIEKQNDRNKEYNQFQELHNITSKIIDYLNIEDSQTHLKKVITSTKKDMVIDGKILCNYYGYEKGVVGKLKKRNISELSKYEKERIRCFEKIEKKNSENIEFNNIFLIKSKTQQILEYLDTEDKNTKQKNTISSTTTQQFSDNTTFGMYFQYERKVVRKLLEQKTLSKQEQERKKCLERIEKQNDKNKEYNSILYIRNKTNEILEFLEAYNKETSKKNILLQLIPDTFSDGTKIGQYYSDEISFVKKIKQKKNESQTNVEKERVKCFEKIEFYNGLNHLEEYYNMYGDLNIITGYRGRGRFRLKEFIDKYRKDFYKENKSEEQLKRERILSNLYPGWITGNIQENTSDCKNEKIHNKNTRKF